MTVADLVEHYRQRELAADNTWKSYSTQHGYESYTYSTMLKSDAGVAEALIGAMHAGHIHPSNHARQTSSPKRVLSMILAESLANASPTYTVLHP